LIVALGTEVPYQLLASRIEAVVFLNLFLTDVVLPIGYTGTSLVLNRTLPRYFRPGRDLVIYVPVSVSGALEPVFLPLTIRSDGTMALGLVPLGSIIVATTLTFNTIPVNYLVSKCYIGY